MDRTAIASKSKRLTDLHRIAMSWIAYVSPRKVVIASSGVTEDGIGMQWLPLHVVDARDSTAVESAVRAVIELGTVRVPVILRRTFRRILFSQRLERSRGLRST